MSVPIKQKHRTMQGMELLKKAICVLHEGLMLMAADRFSLVVLHAQDGKASVKRTNDLPPGAEALRI